MDAENKEIVKVKEEIEDNEYYNYDVESIKQEVKLENETQLDECKQEITEDFDCSDNDVSCSEEGENNREGVRKLTTALQEEKVRKRKELARERAKRYRERKRFKEIPTIYTIIKNHNSEVQNYTNENSIDELENIDQQIQEEKEKKRKELARERAKRYREKKRNGNVDHLIHDSKIPGPSHLEKPQLIQGEVIQKRKELARERSRRFREKKRINALENVDILIQDSEIPFQTYR